MSDEEIIKDVVEIVELAKEEIESNDENITATLDLQDLKSLKGLLDSYKKEKEARKLILFAIKNHYISKSKIKAKIEELKDGTYDAKIILEQLLKEEK